MYILRILCTHPIYRIQLIVYAPYTCIYRTLLISKISSVKPRPPCTMRSSLTGTTTLVYYYTPILTYTLYIYIYVYLYITNSTLVYLLPYICVTIYIYTISIVSPALQHHLKRMTWRPFFRPILYPPQSVVLVRR